MAAPASSPVAWDCPESRLQISADQPQARNPAASRGVPIALVVHSRDYPAPRILDALVQSGYHVVERARRGSAEVAAALQPRLIVAAVSPIRPADLQSIRELSRSCDAFIVLLAPSNEGMAEGLMAGATAFIRDEDEPGAVTAQFMAVLRRQDPGERAAEPTHLATTSALEIDASAHRAIYHGQPLDLTPMEFSFLWDLACHADAVCDPSKMVESATGVREEGRRARELVKVHILRLRRKLHAIAPDEELIANVHGVGYRLNDEGAQKTQGFLHT